jgi:[ribosomal protein S5]-alanine N-acetyltransferase
MARPPKVPEFSLRPWTLDDIPSLIKHANNMNIARYMMDRFPHPYTKEKGLAFVEFANNDFPVHMFAIEINGEAIGGIGIHPQTDIMRRNAEIGYWVAEQFWGRGIATRAVEKMVKFAFTNYDIDRIFARTFGNNPASGRVLEKCGFVQEAYFKNTLYKFGETLDEIIYAIRRQPGHGAPMTKHP